MLPSPSSAPAPDPSPRPGRPRALDETKRREVCALITAGCGIEGAARYVGCAPSTIRREALRNVQFNEELRRANLAAELSPLNAMRHAAATHWRAAAWLLERTNPQRFARQNVTALKPEQLKEFTAMMIDILNDETRDRETRTRIKRRVDAIIRQVERDVWAKHVDPCPKPRRPLRSRPPRPEPIEYQPPVDIPDAQPQT
jgi:hypothetical protein